MGDLNFLSAIYDAHVDSLGEMSAVYNNGAWAEMQWSGDLELLYTGMDN